MRKPNSGSARHRWARENSKHRRTATRQRGFCSSFLKQNPLYLMQPVMTLKNRRFEIIRKAASLRAPGQSTELPKFRVCGEFCQRNSVAHGGIQPAKSVGSGHANIAWRNDQERLVWQYRAADKFRHPCPMPKARPPKKKMGTSAPREAASSSSAAHGDFLLTDQAASSRRGLRLRCWNRRRARRPPESF